METEEIKQQLISPPAKSIVRVIVASIALLIGIAMIILTVIPSQEQLPLSALLLACYLIPFSIYHLLEGIGISVRTMLGAAYLKINNETISIKQTSFSSLKQIKWDNVRKVRITLFSILFYDEEDKPTEIRYDNLDYSLIQRLKKLVRYFSEQRNILIINSK